MSASIGIYLSVPVACFRAPHAREYFETLPVPPPSTLFGMLLSLVGEEDRSRHEGAEVALAMLSEPSISVVLRTTWRVKDKKLAPGLGNNRRPDFQELLTDVRLAAWIRPGAAEEQKPTLCDRVREVMESPAKSNRFGALSLGESTHLVDELRPLRPTDLIGARHLVADPDGDLSLTLWPNHVGSRGTAWGQYRLTDIGPSEPPDQSWTAIRRAPGNTTAKA